MRRILAALAVLLLASASVSALDWMKPVTTPRTVVLRPDGAPRGRNASRPRW